MATTPNSSSSFNKTWLLQVKNLTLVRECRRLISDEFGIKFQLSSDDLLDHIQEYAERSSDPVLQRLARPIAALLLEGHPDNSHKMNLSNIPIVASKKTASGWTKSEPC